jgi:demethylmenaquinone methyltransferase/2-methoxy-6-polyprenyl-1,4-benzoquinol methylase
VTTADLTKRPASVAEMFDQTAPAYDRMNALLSLGMDAGWRRATLRALDLHAGERVLDVAAGTGASSMPLVAAGAHVAAVDFSVGMIAEGRRRFPNLDLQQADAADLPFGDASFDAVTISFGLRNVQHPGDALLEMRRVLRPGGRLVVCEFSHPVLPGFAQVYRAYLRYAFPLAARVSSNAPSYRYLAESILDWPDQYALAGRLLDAGFANVEYRNLTAGIVALHRAVNPGTGAETPTDAAPDGVLS